MLVVVARPEDCVARELAKRWSNANADATVLTPADLSMGGWRSATTAVVAGRRMPTKDVSGVLVRMAHIDPLDLDHIDPVDREYVAAEMNAFLMWWLSSLPCPVLNPPDPPLLTGPAWRRERWAALAARLGLRSVGVHRTAQPGVDARHEGDLQDDRDVVVTVVGERCIGGNDRLHSPARSLACAAGVEMLAVRFAADRRVRSAGPWVDAGDGVVADALLGHLQRPA